LQDTIRSGYARSTPEEKETLPGIHEDLVRALQGKDAGQAAGLMARHLDATIMSHIRIQAQAAENAPPGP
jgi:DNA-binding GntR family transcriptional regulator